ncbi:MAG TPA: phosphoglucosamine mutase [Nanoarchaeota archaeon]|nr:phosphoglucosamine mutase [Nanoarchaeota archaeon]
MRRLFGTDGIRGRANKYPMTGDVAFRLGAAVVYASGAEKPRIVVGKDTRASGYIFEYAIASGICSAGGDILFVGVLPTPAIAYLTKKLNADAGIVISASHNPAEDNGIKIFSGTGFKMEDEKEEKIEGIMFSSHLPAEKRYGKAYRIATAVRDYIDFAKSTANVSLKGIRIVVDCANGAAYAVAKPVFEELNAEVIVLNNTPNGENINKNCGALHTEGLADAVLKNQANLGIALDGDADRIIVIDENGSEIDGDEIMYVCSTLLKRENKLKHSTVVATLMSNAGLEESLSKQGIKLIRAKVGDRYVIDEMRKEGYNFGGEQSGHIIFMEHTTTGDGIICGLQLLKAVVSEQKPISELAKGMQKYPQILINVPVKDKKDFSEMENVSVLIKQAEKELEGKGRVLVRYSGTENLARVMIEAKTKETAEMHAKKIANALKEENRIP